MIDPHNSNYKAKFATTRYPDKPTHAMGESPRQPQAGISHLPPLERLLPSRDWSSSNHRIYQNPYHIDSAY